MRAETDVIFAKNGFWAASLPMRTNQKAGYKTVPRSWGIGSIQILARLSQLQNSLNTRLQENYS